MIAGPARAKTSASANGTDSPQLRGKKRRPPEATAVAMAERLADERLGGEGETVEGIGGYRQELQKNLIGGKRGVAEAGAEEHEAR